MGRSGKRCVCCDRSASSVCWPDRGLRADARRRAVTPTRDGRRIDERIRTLQNEAERLAGTARTLVDELRGLEVERDLRGAEADKADAAVAEAQGLLAKTDARLAGFEQERVERLPGLQAQLVDLYKRGSLGYAQMLFSAADVRELGRASRTLTGPGGAEPQADRGASADVGRPPARNVSGNRPPPRELQQRQASVAKHTRRGERAVTAHAARLAEIDARRDLTAQYVGELQVARDTLLRQLDEGAADRAVTAVPLPPFQGALEWPATGAIMGQFGQTANRLGGSAVRNGVEIATPEGTPVHAVHGGTVAHADAFPGFGNLVIVDHGTNHYTLYGYLGVDRRTDGPDGGLRSRRGYGRAIAGRPSRPLFRAAHRRSFRGSRRMAQATVMSALPGQAPVMSTKSRVWESAT